MILKYIRSMSGFNRNVRLFLAQIFIMGIYSGIYGIVFNLYVLDIGYRTDFLGLLLSVSLLATSLASVPAGMLCDRFDRKKLIVGSSVLSAIAMLPLFLSPSPIIMLAASALSGMLGAIATVCATPFLSDNCETDQAVHVFSVSSALTWAAMVIGSTLGGLIPLLWPMLHINASRYQITLVASMLLVFAGCALLVFLKDTKCRIHHTTANVRGKWKVRPSTETLKFTAISVIIGIGAGMVVPYFNVYFTKIVHASIFETGLVFAVADIFMVAGFIAIPHVAQRIGRARSAVITQTASLPFLIMMAITTNFLAASTAYIMRMFLMNMAGPAQTSLQMEVIKQEERGFAVGLMSTGNSLAVAVSTYISGLLMTGGNFTIPFIITCIAYVGAAALLYIYFGKLEGKKRIEKAAVPQDP
ncbi:MAG TPA: MFS transporter [Methanocella sp.]|nr:MFS transporter [Methanocella sp.]